MRERERRETGCVFILPDCIRMERTCDVLFTLSDKKQIPFLPQNVQEVNVAFSKTQLIDINTIPKDYSWTGGHQGNRDRKRGL